MDPKQGGVSQAVRNIILNNLFCEHEVVCMDGDDLDYGTYDTFSVHKTGPGKTSFKYSPALLSWLKTHLADYSHVVVHGIWQYHNFAAYQALRSLPISKKPFLYIMPHGMLDPYFQKAKDRKFKAMRNRFVWLFIEKKAINAANGLLFTCEEEMVLARQTFSEYKPQKELNVGLGVMKPPTQTPKMREAFIQATDIHGSYWLFLSRLHPKKGIALLINAYKDYYSKDNTIPSLVVAGPIDDHYGLEMKKLAADNSKIVFTGMIGGDTKWGAFYGCNAFILPSYQENFGIAIVEAMACKKPVVITPNINIWREIINTGCGLVIKEQTKEAVKDALVMLNALSEAEIKQIGVHAVETYCTYFDLEVCAKRFVELLKTNNFL